MSNYPARMRQFHIDMTWNLTWLAIDSNRGTASVRLADNINIVRVDTLIHLPPAFGFVDQERCQFPAVAGFGNDVRFLGT